MRSEGEKRVAGSSRDMHMSMYMHLYMRLTLKSAAKRSLGVSGSEASASPCNRSKYVSKSINQ